ncbi:hypothetical protein BRC79_06880 [Halobacteriales archaeon QH_8_67_27]|nr:MAG: hypothetical protein BRC79_06880 [Halobacteriales archaeon QH_8_67_27]
MCERHLFARTGGLAVFVAMAVAAAVALGVIVVGAALVLRQIPSTSPRDDEVLPGHYASLVRTSPSNYSGYCPECDTANDPEYTLCRNCSSKLPESRYDRADGTMNGFLGQE